MEWPVKARNAKLISKQRNFRQVEGASNAVVVISAEAIQWKHQTVKLKLSGLAFVHFAQN